MEPDLKKLGDELKSTHEQFKTVLAQEEAERKKLGEATSETKALVEQLNTRLDEIEKKAQRAAVATPAPETETKGARETKAAAERKAAFLAYCRQGRDPLSAEETKALTVSNDTTGGYLAPSEMVNEIIKGVIEFSPIRSIARVRQTSQRSVKMPKRTGTFAARWVGETENRSETTGLAYGMEEIPAHELYALVDISQQDLEDSAFNLEEELNLEMSEQFGVAEATGFVSGSGQKKPEGLLTNADVAFTASGHATQVTGDGLIQLVHDVKAAYARNGRFVLNRQSIAAIRKLKDGQGQYLWAPGLNGPTSATILGYPYDEAVDMPAIAGNAFPVVFGDFKRAYVIADRVDIAVVRDNLTQASSGNVRFIGRKRVGGQVILAEAIRKLKISA